MRKNLIRNKVLTVALGTILYPLIMAVASESIISDYKYQQSLPGAKKKKFFIWYLQSLMED